MIVVEERIYEILNQLPAVDGDKPVYAWGDLKHLNKWIKLKREAEDPTYPLIYQTSKKETQDIRKKLVTTPWEIVIATQNTNTSLTNDERWALSFRNVLNPIAERIAEGFDKSGIINWEGVVDLERFGNFGEGNEHFTVDIWDAITFKATITINNKCLNKIQWK
ncbi:hypothetical protein [Salinimicrobium sp. GXAS 041]|uniref:hypothetical protein n=1 Tax=Salinimicrobium sp. GXAS 041 TaxID=3400806 RepID=UPI003C74488F